MIIRPATDRDAAAISGIYNHAVENTTSTYQERPETVHEREVWLASHGPEHPVLVAEEHGKVIGWASLSRFHPRSAYRFTVENSVYIHPEHHRRGIGRALMTQLIRMAGELGYRSIIAGISADQEPSLRLHASLGFEKVGHLHEVGYKFGLWLDVVTMQLRLVK